MSFYVPSTPVWGMKENAVSDSLGAGGFCRSASDFLGGNSSYRRTVINPAHQIFFGLV